MKFRTCGAPGEGEGEGEGEDEGRTSDDAAVAVLDHSRLPGFEDKSHKMIIDFLSF